VAPAREALHHELGAPGDHPIEEAVAEEYEVRVRVVSVTRSRDRDLVEIEFIPGQDSVGEVRAQNARIMLDAETWSPSKGLIRDSVGEEKAQFIDFPQRRMWVLSARPVFALPVEWIALRQDTLHVANGGEDLRLEGMRDSYVRISNSPLEGSEARGGASIGIEAAYFRGGKTTPYVSVRCAWKAGELWWRTFERKVTGHTVLEAEMVEFVSAPRESDDKAPGPESPPKP
jgi:hypothetical protein